MTKTRTRPTAADEVATLQNLSQASAAWLVNVNPRTLRDYPIERNDNGRFDARDLVTWASGRLEGVELPDDVLEQVTLAAEALEPLRATTMRAVVDLLTKIESEFGDRGLLEFARVCRDTWSALLALYGAIDDAGDAFHAEQKKRREVEQQQRDALRVCVTCEKCGRVRHGRQWIKQAPPAGVALDVSVCPRCEG